MSLSLDPAKAPQFLDAMLRRNKIVLISATYCQFSTKLKMLFIETKHRFVSLEIDIIPNGREVFAEVVGRSGQHTVPQVFLNGRYLGGYDDVIALYRKGTLSTTLEKK
ncbi:glutaredoxin 3 [Strigomonas culicis]|uniref:Glutaredoxin 3 n=1 Tax=Strigomonas culicis TaxID=28005 RepID=S9W8A1_9TRYP|nr:glutaredoxin 3 [Strigomonas culicis]EPY35551.1 glutaredoxin 3 [Strigomonas culicis]|eukprot:EPY33794.1 glutaredoxin 3 [Strigomonas culicis]